MEKVLQTSLLLLLPILSISQTIEIKNGDFEFKELQYWSDCGFLGESPPDIFSRNLQPFDLSLHPKSGLHAISLVVRDNETYEAIGQKLAIPLSSDHCYEISLLLAKSPILNSHSRVITNESNGSPLSMSYAESVIFRILGGQEQCEHSLLLATTDTISHNTWEEYTFRFCPDQEINYISFGAFWKGPVSYCGNIAIDDISDIRIIPRELTNERRVDSIMARTKQQIEFIPSKKNMLYYLLTSKPSEEDTHILKLKDDYNLIRGNYTEAQKYGLYRMLNDIDNNDIQKYLTIYSSYFGEDQYYKNVQEVFSFVKNKRENGPPKNYMDLIKKQSSQSLVEAHPTDWKDQFLDQNSVVLLDYIKGLKK